MKSVGKLCYSVPEAMTILGISRQLLYDEVKEGRLRTFQAGRRRMVSEEALRQWIKDREFETNQDREVTREEGPRAAGGVA